MQRKYIFYRDIPALMINEKITNRFKNVLGDYIPDTGHARRDQILAYAILKQLHWLGVIANELVTPTTELILSLAARYHDIGWSVKAKGNGAHAELSRELIRHYQEKLEKVLSKKDLKAIAFIVAHHGTTEVAKDPYFADIGQRRQKKLTLLSAILRLADVLDREPVVSVEYVDVIYEPQRQTLMLLLRDKDFSFLSPERAFGQHYAEFIEKYSEKTSLLQSILGLSLELATEDDYQLFVAARVLGQSFIDGQMLRELDLQRNNSQQKRKIKTTNGALVVRFGQRPHGKSETQQLLMPRPAEKK